MSPRSPHDLESTVAYQLHKQHLTKSSKSDSVTTATGDLWGLHATSSLTPYISLYNRIAGFTHQALDEELYSKRSLLRTRCMRGTLFLLTPDMVPIAFQATRPSEQSIQRNLRAWGIQPREYKLMADIITQMLQKEGKTVAQIKKLIPPARVRRVFLKIGRRAARSTNVSIIIKCLITQGILSAYKAAEPWENLRPKNYVTTWTRVTANRYTAFSRLAPSVKLDSVPVVKARLMLVRGYVERYGPVTLDDISWWTGFDVSGVKSVIEGMKADFTAVQITGLRRQYLMTKQDYERMIQSHDELSGELQLLPYEDPYTKGFGIRERLINPKREHEAYFGGGVLPSVVLEGRIIGTWDYCENETLSMRLKLLRTVEGDVGDRAVVEAQRLGKFLCSGSKEVRVELVRGSGPARPSWSRLRKSLNPERKLVD